MKKFTKKGYIAIGISFVCVLSIIIVVVSSLVINNINSNYSYNALNSVKTTLKEEVKDDKIYTFNEGDEENEFIISYENGNYYIEYKNRDLYEEGYPAITQKFKKAFPNLKDLKGELSFVMGGRAGFDSKSPHWMICVLMHTYKNSSAYLDFRNNNDQIINGKYVPPTY